MEQYEDGHLGGCVKGGDPATYYPNMWSSIIEDFKVKSILDIGCGEGHSLEYFHSKGVKSVGLEGCEEPINNSKVKDLIIKHDFIDGPYISDEYFDAVWCCEFLEHVDSKYEENIFKTIYQSGAKYLFITHAVPGQGGYNHVNLQSASYWIEKLSHYGYKLRAKSTRMYRDLCYFEPIHPCYNHFCNNGLVFVREDILPKNKPISNSAIITWASGRDFCKNPGIKVYVNSLNTCGYRGHKIVFTHDMDMEIREYFEQNDFEIVDVDPNNCKWIMRDRFLAWYKFLENKNYFYVGLFDCKDVVFQEDPLVTCCGLTLISEGKTHAECDWNTKDQSYLRSNNCFENVPFADEPVICAGTILGGLEYVKNLCVNIWTGTALSGKCTDQAVLNYLHQFVYKNSCLSNPIYDNICLTADLPKSHPPIVKDGVFCNSLNGKPYQIYHQYDRVPENKKIIYERYLNE